MCIPTMGSVVEKCVKNGMQSQATAKVERKHIQVRLRDVTTHCTWVKQAIIE